MKKTSICENCKFWIETGGTDEGLVGECRRNSPVPVTLDGAVDDFEERDLIFHRISNLITVRSDVFSAYILVRIGVDGPQRRVLAILDRSQVDPSNSNSRVKIRAIHKVSDPW